MKQAHRLAAVDGQGLEARVLGNAGLVSGWRRTLVRVVEDDGLVDRQCFVHLTDRRDGRWRLLSAYEVPDPG